MKRPLMRGIVALVGLLGVGMFAPNLAEGLPARELHYPDLRTLTPSEDLQIQLSDGKRLLLFSNTVWNGGDGPLELLPRNDAQSGKTRAYQRVFTHKDPHGRKWHVSDEFQVGTFEFHEAHNHWHFEGFANYDLRNVQADGSIGKNTQRSSQKTSFCVMDTTRVHTGLEHSSSSAEYRECDQQSITGLSVGWGDRYVWWLPGQSIDITNLPDGEYWLVSTADMLNRLRETNDDNNWAALRLLIQGESVTVTGEAMP